MLRLRSLLIELRSSLWFVPTLVVLGSVVLAIGLIALDTRLNRDLLASFPRLFGAGAEGSRGMLSSIASSMITVAGVTFSITIVALSQASTQYSSRILRNFMRDRANQAVLGVFLGIFTYCLIVLRSIRGGEEGVFVPSLSVFVGVVLAIVAIGFLIFFIHHVAASLQASNVIASAANETLRTIDRLFPDPIAAVENDAEPTKPSLESMDESLKFAVNAPKSGYIQTHDHDALVRIACSHKVLILTHLGVGEFVVRGTPIATVYSGTSADEKLIEAIKDTYSIGTLRSIDQDPSFGIRQIVDIALKALSPGVNDTTTALICIDYLTAINTSLSCRKISRPYYYDDGILRVIAKSPTFETFLANSFDEIRVNARNNPAVILGLLQSLAIISRATPGSSRKLLVAKQAKLLRDFAEDEIHSDYEVTRILRSFRSFSSRYG